MNFHRMKFDRPLAVWLAAVIVMIAGFAMPSAASAHTGHPHPDSGYSRIATATVAGVVSKAVLAEAVIAKAVAANPVVANAVVAKSVSASRTVIGETAVQGRLAACSGACCTGGCPTCAASCCGAGLPAVSCDGTATSASGGPAPIRDLSARTDICPETLPEPPRSLA